MSAYNAGDPGSIPGLRRSPGEGNGNPLQYSCLGNPLDGGTWWATVQGVTKGQTWLIDFTFTIQKHQFFGTQPSLWSNFHISQVPRLSLFIGIFSQTSFKIVGNKNIAKILSSHYMPAPLPTPTPWKSGHKQLLKRITVLYFISPQATVHSSHLNTKHYNSR